MDFNERKQTIIARLKGIKNLPAMPKVIHEVTELIQKETTDTVTLARVLGKDQALTARILSVANSPLYGLQRKVSSIEFAILVLGLDEIYRLVMALSIASAFGKVAVPGFDYDEYWKHSLIVGTGSKDIARRLGFVEIATDAFVAGMLHDLGTQLIASYYRNEYNQISARIAEQSFVPIITEQEVMQADHQEVGSCLAEIWNLPAELCDAILFHHHPSEFKGQSLLPAVIHLTDYLTSYHKTGAFRWDNGYVFDRNVIEMLSFSGEAEFNEFSADYAEVFKDSLAEL